VTAGPPVLGGPAARPARCGAGGGKQAGEREQVQAVARAHGATPAQVRLVWTLAQGSHVLAIPGTRSLAHLAENVNAGALRLTEEDLVLLSSVA
jgi:pyridoxine 4-dehydrogenase